MDNTLIFGTEDIDEAQRQWEDMTWGYEFDLKGFYEVDMWEYENLEIGRE